MAQPRNCKSSASVWPAILAVLVLLTLLVGVGIPSPVAAAVAEPELRVGWTTNYNTGVRVYAPNGSTIGGRASVEVLIPAGLGVVSPPHLDWVRFNEVAGHLPPVEMLSPVQFTALPAETGGWVASVPWETRPWHNGLHTVTAQVTYQVPNGVPVRFSHGRVET